MMPNKMLIRHLRLVQELHRMRMQAIEQACEEALQSGVCGVLVYRDDAGVEHIGPHPDVPYGEIHHYPHGHPEYGKVKQANGHI